MTSKILRLPKIGRVGLIHEKSGNGTAIGKMAFDTNLSAVVLRNGKPLSAKESMSFWARFWGNVDANSPVIDLGSGLVTHAGVRLLSQDTAISAGAATLDVMKYHGSGTGTTAATATDTALQTAIGTTATSGTNTNADASPNATVQAQATIAYGGTSAVTEWGLFNQATLSGATMWDHKVFSAINVASGDSIQFTYTLTINSGG
jgi:hypothetical protein